MISTARTNNLYDNLGNVFQLCRVANGEDNNQRIGMSIGVVGLEARIEVRHDVTGDNSVHRIIIFRDLRQLTDAQTTVANFFESVNPEAPINNRTRTLRTGMVGQSPYGAL